MKRSALAATLLVSTLCLAGCSASASDEAAPEVARAPYAAGSASDAGGAHSGAGSGTDGGANGGPADLQSDPEGPQVVTTGWATILVEEPTEAARALAALVEKAGGAVQSRQEFAPVGDRPGSATLTLRVPSARLTATIDSFDELGEVREVSTSDENVRTQVVDLRAREGALQASVDRLVGLLATADTTATLLQVESTLSERQADLESLQAQLRDLEDRVALSTLTVDLIAPADAPADAPSTFLTGLETGWSSFVGFLAGLLVLLGVLLPWLAFVAVVGLVALLVVRARRRRRPAVRQPEGGAPQPERRAAQPEATGESEPTPPAAG